MPKKHYASIHPKSGNFESMLYVWPGIIDSGYLGPWKIVATNFGPEPTKIVDKQCISQAIFHEYITPQFKRVSSLKATPRGSTGFGGKTVSMS